ncbi:MAG: PhzF family phenazine biosynthesis protein [Lachnospiraceae bacterium]|nr:PhzF family phenazine biosynthesis protein [Lachnospiraceae bacterium]
MKQYIVDAFTDKVFHGNPAAICVMNTWLDEETMIQITCENNLSETAFAVPEGDGYYLRWFTPGGEIDLCGHATLGTAYVILTYLKPEWEEVTFQTMSGPLRVVRKGELFEMDFPVYDLKSVAVTSAITEALGEKPEEAYMGRDLLCVFEKEETVRNLTPDLEKVKALDGLLLQVTARSTNSSYDCVSRSFAPKLDVAEDPVCGSGHCHIIPYWAKKTGKNSLTAYQASRRGGTLYCKMDGNRIYISGKVVLYSVAEICGF